MTSFHVSRFCSRLRMLTALETDSARRSNLIALGWYGSPQVLRCAAEEGGVGSTPAASTFGILQTVALALGLKDVTAMREPIQGGSG